MKSKGRIFTAVLALLLTVALMAALPSASMAQKRGREFITTPIVDSPILVKMSDWKDSRPGQRYAFLIGFMSMLDLENEWQKANNEKALPFKQSLVSSWAAALEKKSLQEIYRGLNRYAKENPDQLDKPVTEVMWFTFVQPTVTEKLEKRN